MESSSWPERLPVNKIKAIQELTNGHELSNKLREMLGQPEKVESDLKSVNGVMVQIVRMFQSTLSILLSSNLNGISHNPADDVRSASGYQKQKDFGKSIKTMTPVKTRAGCYKRGNNVSTITEFTSTLTDDGYAWRKYGQKVILNSKHQRSYYRCTHRVEQGCQVTKQVQKISDEPSTYKITYNGFHTCNSSLRSQIVIEPPRPRNNSVIISFETNTLMENINKVGTCLSSTKHIPKEGFHYLGYMKHEQVTSSYHHTPWDSIPGLSSESNHLYR